MNVLLFEYVAGGGWWEVSPEPPSGGLLAEGRAMLVAAAADFVAAPGVKLTLLRDARLDFETPAGSRVVEIDSAPSLRERFHAEANRADAALVVAPETDGALARFAAAAESQGARLLGPSVPFVEIAADKQRTAARLAAAGVPVPSGVAWPPGESWPRPDRLPHGLAYPLVWKPRDGCGSQDVRLVASPSDPLAPAVAGRLEEFNSGTPASCLILRTAAGDTPLPACRQRFAAGGFELLGVELLNDAALAARAQSLALSALAAMPDCTGLIGVDLVLNDARDVVIEINPRLTTSYVLVRKTVKANLAAAMMGR